MTTSEERRVTPEIAESVLSAVEAGRDELIQTISDAVKIPSVDREAIAAARDRGDSGGGNPSATRPPGRSGFI